VILFVTGTGTGIGKTVVAAALASCATGSVAVVKPAQTGVAPGEPADLAEVAVMSGCPDGHEFARYPDPLSPHHAAAISGLPELDLDDVVDRIGALADERDLVLVEGAGGLLVPFTRDGWTLLDLATELGGRIVLVTAAGLGTLSHTAAALQVLRTEDLGDADIVIGSWPREPGLAERCNAADLARRCGVADLLAPAGLGGAVPADAVYAEDFPALARAALAPRLGGTFDSDAFVAQWAPPHVRE